MTGGGNSGRRLGESELRMNILASILARALVGELLT